MMWDKESIMMQRFTHYLKFKESSESMNTLILGVVERVALFKMR
jgi:hypothetical protein